MKRLVLVALVACGGSDDAPAWQQLGSGSAHRVGLGPAAGGGFVPGGGASSTALAGTGLSPSGATIAIDPTYTQRRVSGACTGGNSVQTVNQDGTVGCVAAGAGNVTSGTLTSTDLMVATGASAIGNYAGSTPSACTAGQAVTQPALSAAGALTATCSSFVTSATLTNTDLVAATGAGAVANYAGSAAASCSNGQGFTGAALSAAGALTGTCGNVGRNAYGGTHFEWSDEFIVSGGVIGAGTILQEGSLTPTFSGGGCVANIGTTTRPGIVECTTGGGTSGRTSWLTSTQAVDYNSGIWNFQWVGGVVTLSTGTDTYSLIAGYSDTTSAVNVANGCFFLYDEGNTATGGFNSGNANDWECVCAKGSTRTGYLMNGQTEAAGDGSFVTVTQAVAALTLPSTNIYNLQIQQVGTPPTEMDFLVNGTKSCVIKTNLPGGGSNLTGWEMQILKSAGTNSRIYAVDYMNTTEDLTSARSP